MKKVLFLILLLSLVGVACGGTDSADSPETEADMVVFRSPT